jgi:hypothetical protein
MATIPNSTSTPLQDVPRPSLHISLADRLATSSIPEANAGPSTVVKITSQFAKGFVPNVSQYQTNFTGTPSFFVEGIDTTPYDAANNIQ